jgi:rod shape determining protein RodA
MRRAGSFFNGAIEPQYLLRSQWMMIPLLLFLMGVSLSVISFSTSGQGESLSFWTTYCVKQSLFFVFGLCIYFVSIALDYNRLRNWSLGLYLLALFLLIGLFFVPALKEVHRWYRIPFLNLYFQPSDFAKITTVVCLAWYLERFKGAIHLAHYTLLAIIVGSIPAALIFKQPDLGTSVLFFPVIWSMLYLAGANKQVLRGGYFLAIVGALLIAAIFIGIIPFSKVQQYAQGFLKEYQIERLNPNTYHQSQAMAAIALGQLVGKGWGQADFSMNGWLPEPYTDAVFPAYAETFGLIGVGCLLLSFYGIIHYSYLAGVMAVNLFGRLVAVGLTTFLVAHIVINIGMMSGILPITGFSLVLISYGGSSILATMFSLGLIQSIYSRRFMF